LLGAFFVLRIVIRNLPCGAMLHQAVCSSHVTSSRKKHLRKQVLFSTKFALWASEIASL